MEWSDNASLLSNMVTLRMQCAGCFALKCHVIWDTMYSLFISD